jgi:hypothetical protein
MRLRKLGKGIIVGLILGVAIAGIAIKFVLEPSIALSTSLPSSTSTSFSPTPLLAQQNSTTGNASAALALVKIGNKYGYINSSGNVAIQAQYDAADSFSNGLAMVKIGDKYGYINSSGNVVIQPQFDWAGSFSNGLAVVKIGNQYGYINSSGNIVVQPQFDQAWKFS